MLNYQKLIKLLLSGRAGPKACRALATATHYREQSRPSATLFSMHLCIRRRYGAFSQFGHFQSG